MLAAAIIHDLKLEVRMFYTGRFMRSISQPPNTCAAFWIMSRDTALLSRHPPAPLRPTPYPPSPPQS